MVLPIPEIRIKNFEKMAFGMFIHFGLYSQIGSGEWAMSVQNIPKSEYMKLKDSFTAEDFDAKAIVKAAKSAGMKYITMVTRHHDGFSLYDTQGLSDYDVMNSAAKRDLVAEFVDACRTEDIVPMLYHTTLDWYKESYESNFDEYLEYLRKSVEILCRNYGEIGGFWFDGNWSKPDADWKLDELYGTIRKYQPEAMIINNTGLNNRGELSHKEIDSVTFERGIPEPMKREGMKKYVSTEMCETMNEHWAVGKMDFKYKPMADLIEGLCLSRKVGANYLLNIGPDSQGKLIKMQEAMLELIGEWMKLNGKAIYQGQPCNIKGMGNDFALETEDGKIYLFVFKLGIRGSSNVTVNDINIGVRAFSGIKKKISAVTWVDNKEKLSFTQNLDAGLFCFDATGYPYGSELVVRVAQLR